MEYLQMKLRRCLMLLNIDPTHNGYDQLLDCVLVQKAKRTEMNVTYSVVSKKYNIKPKSVMRNISYALGKVNNLADRLSALLGFPVDSNALHNGSIIAYLVEYISDFDSLDSDSSA